MTPATPAYEPRFLAGIQFFNRQDFFEAHEVWEDLWHDSSSPERRFYQSLIQAAVALLHFGNGNVRGARRLYQSSKDYARPYLPRFLGLDLAAFWNGMDECFAPLLVGLEAPSGVELSDASIPTLALDSPPDAWPAPEAWLPEE